MEEKPHSVTKKQKISKKTPLIILTCLLAVGILFSFFPNSMQLWGKIYRSCGLREFADEAENWPCSLHVLNVGKADALLLCSEGQAVLIDGGTWDCGEDICRYLRKRGVSSIRLMVATHPDKDHIGGLKKIAETFPVKEYWSPYLPKSLYPKTEEFFDLQNIINEKRIPTRFVKSGNEISVGNMNLRVLGPVSAGKSANNNSIILRVSYDEIVFLLTGDAEKEEERSLVQSGQNLTCNVLKVAHHGSDTSTTPLFLKKAKPQIAVISTGPDRSRLPKQSVLTRLKNFGTTVYRTDENGTVVFCTDGKNIKTILEKSNT